MDTYQRTLRAKYVFDTSAVIILFEKCHLRTQLLTFAQTNDLFVPYRVMEEFFEGDPTKNDMPSFQKTFTLAKTKLESDLLPYFNYDSSPGEIWVMSYTLQNPDCICVIDEDYGRRICELFDLNLTGTIGILGEMKHMKLLCVDELRQIRQTIRTCGFYLSKRMLAELDTLCEDST